MVHATASNDHRAVVPAIDFRDNALARIDHPFGDFDIDLLLSEAGLFKEVDGLGVEIVDAVMGTTPSDPFQPFQPGSEIDGTGFNPLVGDGQVGREMEK